MLVVQHTGQRAGRLDLHSDLTRSVDILGMADTRKVPKEDP